MRLSALFFTRLKALLREVGSLLVLLLCIAAALLTAWYSWQKQESYLTLALVNEDTGVMGGRLAEMLAQEEGLHVVNTDAASARRLLLQDRAQCMVRIPAEFSERLEQREYRMLAELTVVSGAPYSEAVTEPLVNDIMKLWFERQTLYDTERFLQEQALTMTPAIRKELQAEIERIWEEGARIRVEVVTLGVAPASALTQSSPALCRFAAWIPLYLILSCSWMQQPGYHALVRGIRRSGCPLPLLFLTQSAASLVMAAIGFLFTAVLSGAAWLLPHVLLYGLGCLGMALVVCSLCRNDATLLLVAPTVTLSAAALSGLLIEMPDWASVLEAISNILPGRSFYEALAGYSPNLAHTLLKTMLWLFAGLLCACLSSGTTRNVRRKKPPRSKTLGQPNVSN